MRARRAGRGSGEAPVRCEQLHRAADLPGWLALSRLRLPADQVITSAADLDDAKILREALSRLARCWSRSTVKVTAEDAGDLAVLNRLAARPDLAPRIDLGPGSTDWMLPATASQAISSIARDAIRLRTGPLVRRDPRARRRRLSSGSSSTPPAPAGGAGARCSAAATGRRCAPTGARATAE